MKLSTPPNINDPVRIVDTTEYNEKPQQSKSEVCIIDKKILEKVIENMKLTKEILEGYL